MVVAVLVDTGVAAQLRDRAGHRESDNDTDPVADASQPVRAAGGGRRAAGGSGRSHGRGQPPGMEKLAAIEKMPGLRKLAPRPAGARERVPRGWRCIAGVAIGMPSAYYLAAIAVILKAGVAAGTQVAALIVFNLVAFAVFIAPILSYLVAPEATRTRVEELCAWVDAHQRVVITVASTGIGAYLLILGISKLSRVPQVDSAPFSVSTPR